MWCPATISAGGARCRRDLAGIPTEVAKGRSELVYAEWCGSKPRQGQAGATAGLPTSVLYVRLDVEYGDAVKHVQPPDANVSAFDLEHFHDRHPYGVRTDRGAGAEDSGPLPGMRGVCRRSSTENSGLRWKLKITTILSPAPTSASPSTYLSSIASVPSTSETLQ